MGKTRTVTVVALLLFAAVILNLPEGTTSAGSRPALDFSFPQIGSWRGLDTPIDDQIVGALELDDYLNRSYANGREVVDLYIGYYWSSKKTAAAHSPLVCFPGQGWVIGDRERRSLPVALARGEAANVDGTLMTARREGKEMRVFFWYQAWDKTYSSSIRQKLSLLWDRYRYGYEDNALVRITTTVRTGTDDADRVLEGFLQEFYPGWLAYLTVGR